MSTEAALPARRQTDAVPGSDASGENRQDRTGNRPAWRRYVGALGPGLVTGASDDDPSGIATYAQAGAQFRYATIWTVLVSLPLMMAVQEICDRTALATGKSLGALARARFGSRFRAVVGVLVGALLVANLLNIAADLMAIGQGMSLLHLGPAPVWSAMAGVALTVLLTTGSYALVAKIFKWLCLSLLTYVVVLFAANLSWADLGIGMLGLQMRLDGKYWTLVVAILGTTISPYLFFWQTAHRVEELREEDLGGDEPQRLADRGRRAAKRKTRESRADVFAGMALSQIVMFSIIAATAATLGTKKGGGNIGSAADAAKALQPIAGGMSTILFALGFIGSGILAVPVLAGSAAAGMSGLLDKKWGFGRSVRRAPLFYALVFVGTIGGTVLAIVPANPIGLLVFVALVNGVAAAPFLIVVMLVSGNREIMGEHRNGNLARTLGWAAVALMAVAGGIGIWQTIVG